MKSAGKMGVTPTCREDAQSFGVLSVAGVGVLPRSWGGRLDPCDKCEYLGVFGDIFLLTVSEWHSLTKIKKTFVIL